MGIEPEKRTNLFHYDPRKLKIKAGLNVRNFDTEAYQAKIAELAEDIAKNGIRTPIETFAEGGVIYIAHGHTRYEALRRLWTDDEGDRAPLTVPCFPEPKGRNDADRIVDQYRLNIGSPLSPVEIAYNIGRLLKLGWSSVKIAERHTKSESWVESMLKLGEATPETQAAVEEGKISATLVTQIVAKEGAAKAEKTVKAAIKTAAKEGKERATQRHVVKDAKPENEPTVKQMRKLVSILRVHASRGGAARGDWAAKVLIEAGINTDDEG